MWWLSREKFLCVSSVGLLCTILHINLQYFSQCHLCHSSNIFLYVYQGNLWGSLEYICPGWRLKGNHFSWLEPTGYTLHFSIESFPIHFQQHALLQFHIHTTMRTPSIDMFLNPNCSLKNYTKSVSSIFS